VKIIISHDVDHMTAWEHSKDLIIPKFVLRALIEWGLGYISGSEVKNRLLSLVTNKWNQIEELMAFDRYHGIPSTFFIGISNGCYLSYGNDTAGAWIKRIKEQGFDVGVHGIAYEAVGAMMEECRIFQKMSGLDAFGIRMHYLRTATDTIHNLAEIGYVFDTSEPALKHPYKIGCLWEFPLHVMDGNIFCNGARWQTRNLEEARQATKERLEQAIAAGIPYFTLLFHDRYYSDDFKTWRDWYVWFVTHCKELGIDFRSYRDAIAELEGHGTSRVRVLS